MRGRRKLTITAIAATLACIGWSATGTAASAAAKRAPSPSAATGTAFAPTASPAAHGAASPAVPRLPKVKLAHRGYRRAPRHGRVAGPVFRHGERVPKAFRAAASGSNMTPHGGPVQLSPKVYLVFWGTQWNNDPNAVWVALDLYYYFNGLGQEPGDSWSPITSQYANPSGQGPTFNGPVFGGWVQDSSGPAPQSATFSQLAAEAAAGADYFGATGLNSQVFVLSPTGTTPDSFPSPDCAWHSWTTDPAGNFVAFINMPYVMDAGAGCGANAVQSAFDGFTIVGGHEYAETVTDPALNAWYDTNLSGEIGDKCAWTGLFAQSLPTGTFAQQALWDNSSSSCQDSA
jgi:hypothetical protein